MPRFFKAGVLLAAASVLPALALRAQQPPAAPPAPVNEPTAKDAVKAVEKAERAEAKKVDGPVERIIDEGTKRSQVTQTLSYLTDVIGPRLTASPNMKRANEWTRDRLAKWGLENAHLEAWGPFGRGWTLKRFSAQVVEPQCIPLIAFPKAWSPGTDGLVTAEVVLFDAKTEAEFDRFKGKLKGLAVMTGAAQEVKAHFEPLATRLTDKELLELADAPEPVAGNRRGRRNMDEMRARAEFARKRLKFLTEEGAAVLIDPSRDGDGGTLFVAQASVPNAPPYDPDHPDAKRPSAWDKDVVPMPVQVAVAKEHYNRMARMIAQGETIKLAVDVAVQFHDEDLMGYNTVAEVPGTDLKDEVVMLGGHMDSWHSGTGATDNAAGVSVAMEAVRILKALDLKPRRTIRVGLWSGEEEGLYGSKNYVIQHFGKTPRGGGMGGGPASASAADAPKDEPTSAQKAEFDHFSAYFNLDNGTGKVRGVYMQGNDAVRGTFRKWLAPFVEMGATTLSLSNTGGTDHLSFDAIGLPGFQFIQDVVEYDSRTHHSNQDVFDRIQPDDMKQASVVMAAFVYQTAMLDAKLPRKPERPRTPAPAAATTTAAGAGGQQ